MKDVSELAVYLGQVLCGDKPLDMAFLRSGLRKMYGNRFVSEEYGPHILMLEVALSDTQLHTLDRRQLEAFYRAAQAVRRGDSEDVDDAVAVLSAVGLDTFVPEGATSLPDPLSRPSSQ